MLFNDSQKHCIDLVLMALHGIACCCIVLLVLFDCHCHLGKFQNGKALKIDSFVKNHENNGGFLKDMIVDPEVALQSADRKDDKDSDKWFSTNHRIIQ